MANEDESRRAQELYEAVARSTRSEILGEGANLRASGLFPDGVNHVEIEIGIQPAKIHVTVKGPDRAAAAVTSRTRADDLYGFQMTPTASWWFKANDDLIASISLKDILLATKPPSAFKWTARAEHWFAVSSALPNSLNVSSLQLRCQDYDPNGTPKPGLEQDAALLVANWKARFLGRAMLYDPTNNVDYWKAGSPPGTPNGNGFYFEGETRASPRPRVYFQLDSLGELQSITWFTDEKYAGIDPMQGPYELKRVTLTNAWPSAGHHYTCP